MSSVTSERPTRHRKQPNRPGMCAPSPDSRRRVSIDSISIAPTKSQKRKQITIESTDDEESDSVAAGQKKQRSQETTDPSLSDSEESTQGTPVVTKKKRKRPAAAKSSKPKEVSSSFCFHSSHSYVLTGKLTYLSPPSGTSSKCHTSYATP